MPCFVAQSFAFASGNSFFTDSRVQKHKNSAGAEFLDSLLLVVAQGFAFACNFDLPNKQRFSLQRHKALFGLCRILG